MSVNNEQAHWSNVYQVKAETEVSWFEASPKASLRLIAEANPAKDAMILDVGGGASRLIDALVALNFTNLGLLDISAEALDLVRKRLGDRAGSITFIATDIRTWQPDFAIDIWHDRAAFHFLVQEADREAYRAVLRQAVKVDGQVILATFAMNGAERCSGLPVRRHDAAALADFLGSDFALQSSFVEDHKTPSGGTQPFQYARFRRLR